MILLNKHYIIRPMRAEDINQVVEIDREAFPTQWPPPSFSKELTNKLAHYLVVCTDKNARLSLAQSPGLTEKPGILSRVKHLFGRGNTPPLNTAQLDYVVGVVGFWLLFDEAHVITIAVRTSYRQQGIGEYLLLSAIELAMKVQAQVITLEVRPSNKGARALYEKYGFREEGLRVRYYTDNNEDAIIMTTAQFSEAAFQETFKRLKAEHTRRWTETNPGSPQ